MSTDPIADMLVIIKNACAVKKPWVELSHSNTKEGIAKIFSGEGYLGGVKVFREKGRPGKRLHLDLVYVGGSPRVSGARRVSKPGLRVCQGCQDLPRVLSGRGRAVVSTSRGLMTAREARRKRLGGEVLCEIW